MDNPTEVAGIKPKLLAQRGGSGGRVIVELVQDTHFSEGIRALEEALAESADLSGVETIESADSLDTCLSWHESNFPIYLLLSSILLPISNKPNCGLRTTADESALRRVFGSADVKEERIDIGEGETVPGTVLFPDDSTIRLMIIWGDTINRRFPNRLVLRGDSSRWSVAEGITLGTALAELEKLNARPFTLARFGWDYAGVVMDWRGGRLATPLGSSVKLYLLPPSSAQSDPVYNSVLGDRAYASDIAAMRRLKLTVRQIFIEFGTAESPAP